MESCTHITGETDLDLPKESNIDPNYAFYNDIEKNYGHSLSKYQVCFKENYAHSLSKMAKIYYIITAESNVHRMTVERRNLWSKGIGSTQHVYLDGKLLLKSYKSIQWDPDMCEPEITTTCSGGRPLWKWIRIRIEGRCYTLRNENTIHGRRKVRHHLNQGQEYKVEHRFEFVSLRYLRYFMSIFCCFCTINRGIPAFTLSTAAWDIESHPLIPDGNRWTLEIERKAFIDRSWKWFDWLLLFLDVILVVNFVPIYVMIMVLGLPCMICKCSKSCYGHKDDTNVKHWPSDKRWPSVIRFDVNGARRRFNQFHGMTKDHCTKI